MTAFHGTPKVLLPNSTASSVNEGGAQAAAVVNGALAAVAEPAEHHRCSLAAEGECFRCEVCTSLASNKLCTCSVQALQHDLFAPAILNLGFPYAGVGISNGYTAPVNGPLGVNDQRYFSILRLYQQYPRPACRALRPAAVAVSALRATLQLLLVWF